MYDFPDQEGKTYEGLWGIIGNGQRLVLALILWNSAMYSIFRL